MMGVSIMQYTPRDIQQPISLMSLTIIFIYKKTPYNCTLTRIPCFVLLYQTLLNSDLLILHIFAYLLVTISATGFQHALVYIISWVILLKTLFLTCHVLVFLLLYLWILSFSVPDWSNLFIHSVLL